MNSGLEDVSVLASCIRNSTFTSDGPFTMFNYNRVPDLKALAGYANFLNDAFGPKVRSRKRNCVLYLLQKDNHHYFWSMCFLTRTVFPLSQDSRGDCGESFLSHNGDYSFQASNSESTDG